MIKIDKKKKAEMPLVLELFNQKIEQLLGTDINSFIERNSINTTKIRLGVIESGAYQYIGNEVAFNAKKMFIGSTKELDGGRPQRFFNSSNSEYLDLDKIDNEEDELPANPEGIWELRKRWGVYKLIQGKAKEIKKMQDTLAIGKAYINGISGLDEVVENLTKSTFYGGSRKVRAAAGLKPLNKKYRNRAIKAKSKHDSFIDHAEEDILNQLDIEIQKLISKVYGKIIGDERRKRNEEITGVVFIHISNEMGVCTYCSSGLKREGKKKKKSSTDGIIKQMCQRYPNITFVFTSDGDVPEPAPGSKIKRGVGERFCIVKNCEIIKSTRLNEVKGDNYVWKN